MIRTTQARFGVRRPPIAGESLSSWLMRLAALNALQFQSAWAVVAGRGATVQRRDIDVYVAPRIVAGLSAATDTHPAAIAALALGPTAARLTMTPSQGPRPTRWVQRPIDVGNRRLILGAAFCQQCLSSDLVPFLRRSWRLAFYVACPTHRTLLQTACAHCQAPHDAALAVDDARRPLGMPPALWCSHCGSAVAAEARGCGQVDPRTLRFQRAISNAVRRGWTRVRVEGRLRTVPASFVLDVLHRLISGLRSSHRLRQWAVESLPIYVTIEHGAWRPRSEPFNAWPLRDRWMALHWLSRAMADWPTALLAAAQQYNLSYGDICGERGPLPFWFDDVVRRHCYRHWYTPSPQETEAAKTYLQRRGLKATHFHVRRLLGRWYPTHPFVTRAEMTAPLQLGLFDNA